MKIYISLNTSLSQWFSFNSNFCVFYSISKEPIYSSTQISVLSLFVISFFVQTMWSIQKFRKISLFSLLKNMWVAQKSNKNLVKIFLSFIHWNKNATSERKFLRDEDIKAKWCVSSWNYIIAHSCLTRQVFLAPFYLAIYVEWCKYWVSF